MNENLTYHREGDYLLPNVIPPENPHISTWGLRRKNYLLKARSLSTRKCSSAAS